MKIRDIYRLFEAREGHGGPVVTVHLPQKLAEDLLNVLHEAVEVAGGELPGGEEEDELGDDEMELGADTDDLPFGDDEAGGASENEGDFELPAGEPEDDEGSDDESDDEEMDEKYIGFKKLERQLSQREGKVRDPAALAAAIGRKKYGKAKFQAAAAKGKKLG